MMLWCWKWPTPVTTFSLYSFSHKLSTNQRIPVVSVKSLILPFLWTRIKKQFLCLGLHLLYLRARHWETTFKASVWCILHLNIISSLRRERSGADLRRKHAGHDSELITRTAYVFWFWNSCPFLITFDWLALDFIIEEETIVALDW